MVASPSANTATLPSIGDTIGGKYRLVRVIAEGGMGIVYEGVHKRLDQSVAIKILYPHYGGNPAILARFDLEGRIASRLQGLNVARVHDIDSLPNGVLYMVMELLMGHDLETELGRRGQLGIGEACDIVSQAAMGMREAHAMGIVHRDLKPANIFLCPVPDSTRYLAKVLDFGISRVTTDSGMSRVTADFTMLGTALYMSPEQAKNAASVDAKSDIWSLGIIMYELLTGKPPFDGQLTEILVQVATAPITPPKELRPDIPDELDRAIMRALDRDPNARHGSMEELIQDLAPFAPHESVDTLAQRLPRTPPPTLPEPHRFALGGVGGGVSRRVFAIGALVAIAIVGTVLIGVSMRARTAAVKPTPIEDGFSIPAVSTPTPSTTDQAAATTAAPSVAPTSIEIVETPAKPTPHRPPIRKTSTPTGSDPPRRL